MDSRANNPSASNHALPRLPRATTGNDLETNELLLAVLESGQQAKVLREKKEAVTQEFTRSQTVKPIGRRSSYVDPSCDSQPTIDPNAVQQLDFESKSSAIPQQNASNYFQDDSRANDVGRTDDSSGVPLLLTESLAGPGVAPRQRPAPGLPSRSGPFSTITTSALSMGDHTTSVGGPLRKRAYSMSRIDRLGVHFLDLETSKDKHFHAGRDGEQKDLKDSAFEPKDAVPSTDTPQVHLGTHGLADLIQSAAFISSFDIQGKYISDDAIGLSLMSEHKRLVIRNFVDIPMKLERFLFLGLLVCIDEFLTLFTFLPLRIIASLFHHFFVPKSFQYRLRPGHHHDHSARTGQSPSAATPIPKWLTPLSTFWELLGGMDPPNLQSPLRLNNRDASAKLSPMEQEPSHEFHSMTDIKAPNRSRNIKTGSSAEAPPSSSAMHSPGSKEGAQDAERRKECQQIVIHLVDYLHASLFILCVLFLNLFDISRVYHFIRGQSLMKLYVIFNLLDIFEKLCCSFGIDVLDGLGFGAMEAVRVWKATDKPAGGHTPGKIPSFWSSFLAGGITRTRLIYFWKLVTEYVIALVYLLIHCLVLLATVVTLNVAVNSGSNSLLTLLISNNFTELKGTVFKSFRIQNLFQFSCGDAVERFQLSLFLFLMFVYTHGDIKNMGSVWMIVTSCEMVVDWAKHAFMAKFNRIPSKAYNRFYLVLCDDLFQSKKHSFHRSIGGSLVAKRLGLISLPCAALTCRMVWVYATTRLPALFIFMLWVLLCMLKLTVSMYLLGHCADVLYSYLSNRESQDVPDENEWQTLRLLTTVDRYSLAK